MIYHTYAFFLSFSRDISELTPLCHGSAGRWLYFLAALHISTLLSSAASAAAGTKIPQAAATHFDDEMVYSSKPVLSSARRPSLKMAHMAILIDIIE